MEAEEREVLLKKSSLLRQELKIWERNFAAANGGRKAGRDDIKQNPTIAQKYKDYNLTRDILSGKIVSQRPSPPKKVVRKRKQETAPAESPSKRLQITKTPSKPKLHPAMVDPYDSPSLVRTLFTPSTNRVIGPTPQKDGQVLGLFDLLSEHDDSPVSKGQIGVTGPEGMSHTTPRKPNGRGDDAPGTIRHSRTPASSGKRFMLDSFATPLKRRHPNELGGKTPSSVSRLHFTTPSFLRRDSQRTSMAPIQESSGDLKVSPQMTHFPRKPLVRGLSSMLASLRRMEEEAADDDLDAMREMENENQHPKKSIGKEILQVEDSQPPVLLGGFDDEAMYDSEPEELKNPPLGRDGQPLQAWKKKGQKRTTRRTIIKPVRQKTQPTPQSGPKITEAQPPDPFYSDENDRNLETQDPGSFSTEAGNFDSDSASEYTASEGGTRYRRPNQEKRKKKNPNPNGEEGEEKGKKMMRKVGAMAHANFKRLKLRNSGAKGGAGTGSRFRRRR